MLDHEGESDLCECHNLMSRATMCTTGSKLDIPCPPAGGLGVTSCPIPRVITKHDAFCSVPKVSDRQPGFVCLNDFYRFRASHVPDSDDAFLGSNRELHTIV